MPEGATPPIQRGDFETSLSGDDGLDLRVWLRLLTCSTLIERRVRQRLREQFDITLPRFDLLAQLDRAPDGLTMGALSRRLMVSNGNVTGLIDRLVAEDLVERQPAPGDRRAQLVRLTQDGKRAFDRMTPAHAAWIRELFASLDRKAQITLFESLAELKTSLANAERG
ncbi:MAG: MarR family transcriptional regulator [Alphaproteobacteria bacterium]|nr:MarR family transcriptional regulator [Alphaproteobacteria bacterium]